MFQVITFLYYTRILEMAEKEAEHQRKMEETALSEAIKESKRGQNYGLVVTLAAFTTASFAIYSGGLILVPVL